jgi:hypothetical protein
MISGRLGCELAMVAVFCVLTILLFPSVQGPYSVVNGPVTALQASRAAVHLRIAIMQAAFRSLGNFLIVPGHLATIQRDSSLLILLISFL